MLLEFTKLLLTTYFHEKRNLNCRGSPDPATNSGTMNPELFIESGQQDVVNVLFCYKNLRLVKQNSCFVKSGGDRAVHTKPNF